MADASEYLVEISCLDANDVARTLYLSSGGYTTTPADTPPNQYYEPRISDIGPFTQNIFAAGYTTGSTADVGYGSIALSNADGALDEWLDYAFDGRTCVIKRLPIHTASYNTATTIFTGTIERLDAENAWSGFRLRVYDNRLLLDRPLQTNVYAGTTNSAGATAEGTVDLRDSPKPLAYGKVYQIPAVQVNAYDHIYQVNDGPVVSISVYDGAVPLITGSDYATLALLQAASVSGGTYATCLSLGLFKLGSSPSKVITADVVEAATTSTRYAGSIVRRILEKAGVDQQRVDAASADAVDADAPYECGIWLNDTTNAIDAISAVLASVGGWMVPNHLGVFTFGRMDEPETTAESTIDYETDIILTDGGDISITANPDTDGGLPAWRVIVSYARVYQTQDGASVHGCVDDDFRGFVAKELRETKVESAAVRTRHPLSTEMRIETALTSITDAVSEAARRLTMYSVRRDLIHISIPAADAAAKILGSTTKLTLPRFGYEAGRQMVVIGREDDLTNERVKLVLWG